MAPAPALRTWRTFRIIHAALTAGLVVYAAVAIAVTRGARAAGAPPVAPLWIVAILGLAGAVLLAIAPVVAHRMMPPRRRAAGAGDDADGDLDLARLDGPMGRRALAQTQRALMTLWSLYEAVAALGLVGAILLGDAVVLAPFGLVAVTGLVAYAPRRRLLQQVVRALPTPR